MTNKALKRMINDEVEQLKPDRSVLDKAKSIMMDMQYNSIEVSGGEAACVKSKFTLFHLALVLTACVIVVTLSVCLPFAFLNNSWGGISGGELTTVTIPTIAEDAFAVENGLLHFDYDGITTTEAKKYENIDKYICINEKVFSEKNDKYLNVYVNGNDLSGNYDYDILSSSCVSREIVVTYDRYDANKESMYEQNNTFTKVLRGKFEYGNAKYYFEVYGNDDVQIDDVIGELLN